MEVCLRMPLLQMAIKLMKMVLKLLLSKYAPMSVQMQQATLADQSVQREYGHYDYVDNNTDEAKATLAERAKERAADDAEFTETRQETPQATEPSQPGVIDDLPWDSEDEA